jgi:tetratricopeptide (TPR) repeat protein
MVTLLGLVPVLVVLLCLGVAWTQFSAPHNAKLDLADAEDAGPEVSSGQADISGLRDKVLPALVTVVTDHGWGTGFVIWNGLVVTAGHVVPRGCEATVVFKDGERAKVMEHLMYDSARDVAVLRIETKRKLELLELASALPAAGDPVVSFKPGGGELRGVVMRVGRDEILQSVDRRPMFRTTLRVSPGWSGSPVVSMEGKVVGIHSVSYGPLLFVGGFHSIGTAGTTAGEVPVTVIRELLVLAILRINEAIRLNPDSADRYHHRAGSYHSPGDFDKVITDYTEVIRRQPKLARAYYDRGIAYLRSDYDKAIADFSEAIRLEPNDSKAHVARGLVHAHKGDNEKAVADYTKAIRLAPKEAALYQLRGLVYAEKGDHDMAMADFAEAILLDPENVDVYCARGAVRRARREFSKAVADFTEAIRLDPALAKAHYNRAAVYTEMGYWDKALADLERAKKLGYRPE